ncbi:hypothetical protein XHV734_2008 [Xanthomonas hortorum pv. vitians]|nr:hypothetical protein XHV734_2008 [Xanthomonas hortorum pv. vitians]
MTASNDETTRNLGRLEVFALADRSVLEPMIFSFAAGPLPAHHRGTRCKYVLVSSYAASMPRKVPRR